MRSAPVRSTRTEIWENFASNDLAIRSASSSSIEVYQTTLPSRCAAAISAGVIVVASGAAATSGSANTVAPTAAEALMTSRLEKDVLLIGPDPRAPAHEQTC